MKMPKCMLCVLLTFTCAVATAQKKDDRPKLFADYPQVISTDKTVIANGFTAAAGSSLTLTFSNDFSFTGTVISNQKKYANLQTLVIRAAENNTLFQLNRITNGDQSISYTGRTFNDSSADGYELKCNGGTYTLNKFETAKVLEPCHL